MLIHQIPSTHVSSEHPLGVSARVCSAAVKTVSQGLPGVGTLPLQVSVARGGKLSEQRSPACDIGLHRAFAVVCCVDPGITML